MAIGWICLHREIADHWIWTDEPYTRAQAWIDLLLKANFAPTKILFDGNLLSVDEGAFVTSIVKLSERWSWSTNKTRTFLNMLESDGMITRQSDNKKTIITIVNWAIYQDLETSKKQQKNSKKTADELAEVQQENFKRTADCSQDNNVNKLNNDKQDIIADKPQKAKRFAPPTLEDVQSYCLERQNNVDAERFVDYYIANGWMAGKNKMKDWKACVRTWEKNNFNNNKQEEKTYDERMEEEIPWLRSL